MERKRKGRKGKEMNGQGGKKKKGKERKEEKRNGMERMERNEKKRKGKGSRHGKDGRLPNGRRYVEREAGKNREIRREERKVGGEIGGGKGTVGRVGGILLVTRK